jgi:hypothetical protein
MQEYVDLIKEKMAENGIEWDNTTAHLAVYKYIKSPAISHYYHNFEMKRSYGGEPVICETSKNGSVMSIGTFTYDSQSGDPEQVSYEMKFYGNKPKADDTFYTKEIREQMSALRERFLNSNNFADFSNGFSITDIENYEALEDKLDFKIRKFLRTASIYNEQKDQQHSWFKKTVLENILSVIDDSYKFSNHRHQTLVMPILNMITKEKVLTDEQLFDDLYTIAAYDDIVSDNYYFDIKSHKEKIEHYLQVAKMPEIKDNTVLGIVINHPDDIINKLADTFMFDELKTLALIQTRLAMKAITFEEMLESRPIVDEIYQEAVRRSPMLETDINERFEHMRINDKSYDLAGEESVSFSLAMDSVGIYSKEDKDHYLILQTEMINYPSGTANIRNINRTERFVGHDGVGPYYVLFAYEDPLTLEVNSLVFDNFHISKNLDDKHVKQLFINMFDECMARQLPLVIENVRFETILGEERFKLFEEVREQYKGIVPSIVAPVGLNKYRALLETELTYSQLIAIEPKLDELVMKRSSLPTFRTFIEEQSKGLPEIKKTIPKL